MQSEEIVIPVRAEFDEMTASLLEVKPQRYGVIVGIAAGATPEAAGEVKAVLEDKFPGVQFCVVSGASSVAFPLPDQGD